MSAFRSLDEQGALHHARCSEVAVPALDRVLLDEAVAAEQLYSLGADLHALARAEAPRQCRLSGEVLAAVGATRRPVGDEAHPVGLYADVGDGEGDALAVGDRFAEGTALVDVRDHVVEDRLRGSDRERGPGDARAIDALDVVLAAAVAEDRGAGDADALEHEAPRG